MPGCTGGCTPTTPPAPVSLNLGYEIQPVLWFDPFLSKHGHAGRIVKDAEDVIRLIQNNSLDPDAQTVRELFLKHGTEELYEKVRTACRRE